MKKQYIHKGIAFTLPLILGGLAIAGVITGNIWGAPLIQGIAGNITWGVAKGLAWFLNLLLPFIGKIFIWLGTLSANLIDIFSVLNPFDASTLAPFIWNTFKNIAYVAIIFLSLYAGFMWIVGKDDEAKQMLVRLLIVAFLINFTFILVKEVYYVSFVITKNLACAFEPGTETARCNDIGKIGKDAKGNPIGKGSKIGTAIYTSLLSFMDPDSIQDLAAESKTTLNAGADDNAALFEAIQGVFANMTLIVLYFIFTTMMFIFAGMFVGRFIIITLLVGLLPLAIIAWSMPKYGGGRWNEWSHTFLTWTTNIPTLLILVLVGLSIMSIGMKGGWAENLQNFSNPALIGAQDDNVAKQGYAGLIRYFFIVAYYAFVINYAQKIGGGFATFGVNFAKGTYLTMAGAVAGVAGKTYGATAKNSIGKLTEDWGNKLAGSGIPGTYNLGKTMRGLGETMQKGRKEKEEETAKARIEKIKDKPEEIRAEIKRLSDKKQYGILKNFIASDKIDWDTEEWVNQISQIPEVLDSKEARVILSKKWKGLGLQYDPSNPQNEEKMAETLASIDIASAGGWNNVEKILTKLKFPNPDEILRKAWTSMSSTKRQKFATMSENFDKALDLKFTNDPDFIRGFIGMPVLGDIMRAGLGNILNAISQGRPDDAQTIWDKSNAKIEIEAGKITTSIPLDIKTYINDRLEQLPTPPLIPLLHS